AAGLALAAVPASLGIALPLLPLLAVLVLLAVFNLLARRRVRGPADATPAEVASQLAVDVAGLAALLFFTGGATNPLVSLLLPPVAFAAMALPGRLVALVAGLGVAAYSLLMVAFVPLALPDPGKAAGLHLAGMWLTFVLSAAMLGWLIVRMTASIRERDARLAEAREAALANERMVALGALAAGAAHELGTPLATIAVVAGEVALDPRLPEDLGEEMALLRRQVSACKEIISGMAARGGAGRLEAAAPMAADAWLAGVVGRWQALRPRASCRWAANGEGPPPAVVADPSLEQAVGNLLNNAADAGGGEIGVRLGWNAAGIRLEIRDRGPGFPAAVLAAGGKAPVPSATGGAGIGLMLAHAAIGRVDGRLALCNDPAGGALALVELPAKPPT
ncbi:MAG: HAMP domain-containing histidine kinase, partial [Rhodocyclaceae bacterium]|nr:HAMP domain-containing histidine kinase [Rhodocyclaceae bacterium]